nr:hypothetical protein [Clostridia bacterium]
MKKLTLLTLSLMLTLTSCTAISDNADTPLVCAYSEFDGKFSPFYADTVYDRDVVAMTHLSLLTTDRMGEVVYNAVEGETRAYNGTDYTYRGICDIAVERTADATTYRLTLADDLYFSDGHKADADDIIFNYYVYLDPAYIGSSTLASYDIVGLEAYRSGSAPNIAGIVKLDGRTVEITTNGYEAPAIYTLCGIDLAPMHYYGDEAQYDYESNKFGHPFGDLSSVGEKTSQP